MSLSSFSQSVDTDENQFLVTESLRLTERPGIGRLTDYLEESDYFTAPASTRYHGVFSGGLCLHSMNVSRLFAAANKKLQKPIDSDSVIICGLLHDLCKVGTYQRNEIGKYTTVNGHKQHGKRSVSIIEEYIKLTPTERDLITFHMGTFGAYQIKEFSAWDLHKAIIRTPTVQLFAAADVLEANLKQGISIRGEWW